MSRYVLAKAVMTSIYAPAQWDAWTVDGQYLYLRYRHGEGTVTEYPSPDYSEWDISKRPDITFEAEDVRTLEKFARLADIDISNLESDGRDEASPVS